MEKQQIQIKSQPASVKPLFADEVSISIGLKASKQRNEKGIIEKEGYIRLGFIDTLKGQFIAEIVLGPMTAKSLVKILDNSIKNLDTELKSGEPPKIPEIKTTTETPGYIG